MALFAITRGQFSMIDALLHCLDQVGPAAVTLWTWTVAEYEIQCLSRLRQDSRITNATLLIDHGARTKNAVLLREWRGTFGPDSVRLLVNHAKIATLETSRYRLLLRGSMNLNFNPRFEQFDLTEGGPDFDLVRGIETSIPVLSATATGSEVYAASGVATAFDADTLEMFRGVKPWAK